MLNANGEVIELETLSDVVSLLRSKEARDDGVDEHVFHRSGMASIEAVATGLRARGYEIKGWQGADGVKRIRLVSTPGVAAKKRAQAQDHLFPLPPKTRHYSDEAA